MLDVSKDEVAAYLSGKDISWREDSSNADLSFSRNRLRHEVIPGLTNNWNPQLEQTLANTADWHYEEERFWKSRTDELISSCASQSNDGLLLDIAAIRNLTFAEQRRLVFRALADQPTVGAIGFDHIETVRELMMSSEGSGGLDLPGLRIERSFGYVLIEAPAPHPTNFNVPLLIPGRTELPGSPTSHVETRVFRASENEERYNTKNWAYVDWDRVPKPLCLRNWRPGDRYRPQGRASEKKLKHLFQEDRIHSWRRASWPVVASSRGGGENDIIIWARSFGAAANFAAESTSRNLLSIQELRNLDKETGIESKP